MTDSFLTDDAVLERLGERLARARLARDLTQQRLAVEAGVGKTVVERLENGKSVTLANFVRVLRALGLQDELLHVAPESTLRPAELAQRSGRRRQRASPSRGRRAPESAPAPFSWGDERAIPDQATRDQAAPDRATRERSGPDRVTSDHGTRPSGEPRADTSRRDVA